MTSEKNPGERLVLYTANFGRYDKPLAAKHFEALRNSDVSVVVFTDDAKYQKSDEVVEARYLPIKYNDPQKTAREIKILPHRYLSDYDLSIWLDGSRLPRASMVDLARKYLQKSDLCWKQHHFNRNIYREARSILKNRREDPYVVGKQLEFYEREGYDGKNDRNRLAETFCLFRRHNESAIVDFGERWFDQVLSYSRRDQMSFNYALWLTGLPSVRIAHAEMTRCLFKRKYHHRRFPQAIRNVTVTKASWANRDVTHAIREMVRLSGNRYLYFSTRADLTTYGFPAADVPEEADELDSSLLIEFSFDDGKTTCRCSIPVRVTENGSVVPTRECIVDAPL